MIQGTKVGREKILSVVKIQRKMEQGLNDSSTLAIFKITQNLGTSLWKVVDIHHDSSLVSVHKSPWPRKS